MYSKWSERVFDEQVGGEATCQKEDQGEEDAQEVPRSAAAPVLADASTRGLADAPRRGIV